MYVPTRDAHMPVHFVWKTTSEPKQGPTMYQTEHSAVVQGGPTPKAGSEGSVAALTDQYLRGYQIGTIPML